MHYMERPIAQIANLLYQINRDPKQSKPRTLNDWCMYAPPRDDRPNKDVVATFVDLGNSHKLPHWLTSDELMAEMQSDLLGQVTTPRMILGDRVALLCPTVDSAGIAAQFVILEDGNADETAIVHDVDTGEEYEIKIEQAAGCFLTGSDAYFIRSDQKEAEAEEKPIEQPKTI